MLVRCREQAQIIDISDSSSFTFQVHVEVVGFKAIAIVNCAG
jgi:hypothetical protein